MARDLNYKVNDVIVSYDKDFRPQEHYGGTWLLIGGNSLVMPSKDSAKIGKEVVGTKHTHKITHRWLVQNHFAVAPDSTRWGFAEYDGNNNPVFQSPSKSRVTSATSQNYSGSTAGEKYVHTVTGETIPQEEGELSLVSRIYIGFWLKVA